MLGELIEQSSDAPPSRLEGPLGRLSHEMFELGEHLLDRVEVWAVGWQEDEPGALPANGGTDGVAPVAAEIVHDDDVSRAKGWDENLLDIGLKGFTIDRTIKKPWGVDPVMSQCGQEGRSLPVTVRDFGLEPHAERCPPPQRRHVGLGPGLVDEDQALRLDFILILDPLRSPPRDVGSIAFASHHGFF